MAISIDDVFSAADRLSESGQQPTLAAVRSALGGGSFTTISEAMKSWRAMQQAAAAPVREAAPAAVMERFHQLGTDVWAVAISMANDRLAKEREVFESAKARRSRRRRKPPNGPINWRLSWSPHESGLNNRRRCCTQHGPPPIRRRRHWLRHRNVPIA